jgi:hypothetical protein
VRFEIFAVMNMKITIFYDLMPCSVVVVYKRFGATYSLNLLDPEDGDGMFL